MVAIIAMLAVKYSMAMANPPSKSQRIFPRIFIGLI
jgi:hypothetical protein